MQPIIMPMLGDTMEQGTIVRWIVSEGDHITKGDLLFEVETDKAINEVGSSFTGTLGKIIYGDGCSVDVLSVIGFILEPGEDAPDIWPHPTLLKPDADVTIDEGKRAIAGTKGTLAINELADEQISDRSGGVGTGEEGLIHTEVMHADLESKTKPDAPASAKIVASPRAKTLAQKEGISLNAIKGTGPGGRIQEGDVLKFLKSETVVAPSRLQQITAERMTTSFRTVPHFYLRIEIDATELVEWRNKLLPIILHSTGVRLTITDMLVLLLSKAIRRHPRLNATWMEDGIRLMQDINIGVAAAVDDGLIVPVIRQVDQKSLEQIACARRSLVEKAVQGKLAWSDLDGGTFTLTNLGMFGIDDFDAIINPPQSAILAVGKIAERVVSEGGVPVGKPTVRMSLAVDHRVLDGVVATRFLMDLKDMVENPEEHIADAIFQR